MTFCTGTTRSWTRILTLLVDAGKMTCTFTIDNTFRTTAWWCTHISCHTSAGWVAISCYLALWIGTTRRWLAWVLRCRRWEWCGCCQGKKKIKARVRNVLYANVLQIKKAFKTENIRSGAYIIWAWYLYILRGMILFPLSVHCEIEDDKFCIINQRLLLVVNSHKQYPWSCMMMNTLFWDVTSCSLADKNTKFQTICCNMSIHTEWISTSQLGTINCTAAVTSLQIIVIT